jgi:hypothetical protein
MDDIGLIALEKSIAQIKEILERAEKKAVQ